MKNLLLIVALLVCPAPIFASTCTAKIKSGRSPYSHLKANQSISFWSYTVGSHPQDGVVKSFIGDRMLTIPVPDLYDISPGCSKLKEYKENY